MVWGLPRSTAAAQTLTLARCHAPFPQISSKVVFVLVVPSRPPAGQRPRFEALPAGQETGLGLCAPAAGRRPRALVTLFWGASKGLRHAAEQVQAAVCRKFGSAVAVHAQMLYLGIPLGSPPGLVALRSRVWRWSLRRRLRHSNIVFFDPQNRVHKVVCALPMPNVLEINQLQIHVFFSARSLHETASSEILAVEGL